MSAGLPEKKHPFTYFRFPHRIEREKYLKGVLMSESRIQSGSMSAPEGCRRDPLYQLPLAMAYVPWQRWGQTYELDKALQVGTIFPELHKPFLGKRGACR